MAISVEGYGAITQSNAPEIYKAWRRGDIELNAAQQHKVESLVPDDVRYEIDNEQGVARQDGKNQLGEDVKNAESHGGQGGNVAATTLGNLVFGAGAVVLSKLATAKNLLSGFTTLGYGAAMLACAIGVKVCTKLFDNGYDDRVKANDNAESTNSTIDANAQALEESMSAMDDDAENYKDANAELTLKMNGHVSQRAALEDQLATAQMAGDKREVERIQGELNKLKEIMIADEEGGELEEILKNLDEYRYANDQAGGVSDGGRIISDFLKEGTPLGVMATINAVALAVATVMTGVAIGTGIASSAKEFLKPFGVGIPAGVAALAGVAMYVASVALLGASTTKMASKAKKEFECGSSGGDMASKVDNLDSMITQQSEYVDTNIEGYEESNEDEQEDRDKAKEKAEDSKVGVGNKKPKKTNDKNNDDDDKNGNGNGNGNGNK